MRFRTTVALTLSGLAGLGACSRGPASPGEAPVATPRPTSSAIASAEPPRACTPGAARCTSEDEAETCDAEGRALTKARCEAGSICAEGRCTSLRAGKDAAPIARDALRRVAGEGFLDGWSVIAPLDAKTADRVTAHPEEAFAADLATSYRPLCAPEGYVTVPKPGEATAHAPERALLAGRVVAGREGPALLEASFAGGYRVYWNGALVASGERETHPSPLPDEADVPVTVRAGVNDVVVVTERRETAPSGFWLRLREPDGRAPTDLFFAPATPASACAPSDLVDVDVAREPVRGGFDVVVSAHLRGLAPLGAAGLPFRVELAPGTKGARTVGEGTFPLGEVTSTGAKTRLEVALPERGSPDVAVTVAGATRTLSLPYHGELSDRIVALRDAAARVPDSVPEASRASFARHVAMLVDALRDGVDDESFLRARTKEAEGLAEALARGDDPYRDKKGIVYRGYVSPLDGQLEPYVAYVPPSYRPDGKPVPLVVVYHGMNRLPEHALRTVIGRAPDHTDKAKERMQAENKEPEPATSLGLAARHLPGFPDQRAILVAPGGYGDSGPRPMGEEDVMRVVDAMRAAYRIDDRRVSITGYSLGGTVAFVVPLHYPDRFSASAPLCGYPNLATYESVRSVPHQPWEEVMIAKRYIVNYAENGRYLPLRIVHGGLDGPSRSAVVASRYRKLGYRVDFDVEDDLDHDVWDYAYEDAKMIGWLAARKRPEVPAHVHLVTGELRYDRAYWVRLYAMRDSRLTAPSREGFASIDATWDDKARAVRVETKNVKSFALDLGALDPRPTHVTVDAKDVAAPDGTTTLFLEDDGGGFARLDHEPSLAGDKRAGVAGPLDDWRRHRALVVYGTLDPAQTEANRLVADFMASHGHYREAHFPVKADADVTDADLTGQSLVLVGNPASNRVTAAFADALPVRFEPDALTFRGVRYPGKDVGVSFIYPHPRDPAEYVVVHAGVSRRGTLSSRHVPELAPDFLVYDDAIAVKRGDLLLGERKVLAGGFFDDHWR